MNNISENKQIILQNLYEMFNDRKLINKTENSKYKNLFNSAISDDELTVKFENKKYIIHFLKNIIKKQQILKLVDDESNNYVLVLMDAKSVKYVKDVKNLNNIEIFTNFELLINPTKNIYLSQQHILLNESEKNQLLDEYNCTLNELPKISINDPITRYYNAKNNDIFKIIRNNPISINSIVYRVVTEI